MKRFLFECGTRDASASAGLLILRGLTALMMLIGHGLPKLRNFSELKELFYVPDFFPLKYLSPQISLGAAVFAEVLIPVFLILGFATRSAAFILGFMLVIAAFGFHQADPWFVAPPTIVPAKELALLYLIPMVVLIITGAGGYSADAALYREPRKRRLHW